MVDDFHWKNHSCDESFHMRTACANDPTLRHIKTAIAEMQNATMDRIEKMVGYMSHSHAFWTIRMFLGLRNEETIKSMERMSERDKEIRGSFGMG